MCHKTFTFLPPFSPPYCHYSLIARSQALQRRFIEDCSWETAAPVIKDANRVADPSTLRRWFRQLDSAQPAFAFLQRAVQTIGQWLGRGNTLQHGALRLSRRTLFPFLCQCWPLRL